MGGGEGEGDQLKNMNTLHEQYFKADDTELKRRIAEVKASLGSRLVILGHFYQQDQVIEFADHEGDSFSLAKAGAATDAEFIVFCGVKFMAEASVILAKPGQRVFLPDMDAGCPLSDMASIDEVEDAWTLLERAGAAGDFLPITYMNSSAELKSFCGQKGGTVCTSSSAARAFDWALKQGRRIFFFPDENLGRNTAREFGIKQMEIACVGEGNWTGAKLVVWKGYCHVHTLFTEGHVKAAREKYPGCQVVVHPECSPQVVILSDGSGSTAYLKKYAEEAPAGSTVVIGTEINLVARLAKMHQGKRIVPLARSLCPNMFKVSLADLCFTLENLGDANEVFVPDDVAEGARIALDRMLSI